MTIKNLYSLGGAGMSQEEKNAIIKLGEFVGRRINAVLKQYFNYQETGMKMVSIDVGDNPEDGRLIFAYAEKSGLYFQIMPKDSLGQDFNDCNIVLISHFDEELKSKIKKHIDIHLPIAKTRTDLN